METRTGLSGRFLQICIVAIILILLFALAACGTCPPPPVRTKSETELAVAEYKSEWLKHCEGLLTPIPPNEVGWLLQDYADMAAQFAICLRRHNDSSDYLGPIVSKERGNP